MPDLSKFKTAHQLAKELLAGPDHIVVLPTPVFDMPGQLTAFPAHMEVTKIQGVDAVAIMPDVDVLSEMEKPKTEESTPSKEAPNAGHR